MFRDLMIIFGITFAIIILISIFFYFTGRDRKKKKGGEGGDITPPVPTSPKPKKGKGGEKNTLGEWFVFIILLYLIGYSIFCLTRKYVNLSEISTKNKVESKERVVNTKKEGVWELHWKKPSGVYGYKPRSHKGSFEINFLRKDKFVLEFLSVIPNSNKQTYFFLTSENKENSGYDWEGTYDDMETATRGIVRLNEIKDKERTFYVGEHSVDENCQEWIPTIIQKNE